MGLTEEFMTIIKNAFIQKFTGCPNDMPLDFYFKCVLFKHLFFVFLNTRKCAEIVVYVSLQLQQTKISLENAESVHLMLCTFENIKH